MRSEPGTIEAPFFRSTQPSLFSGDLRAFDVTSLGIDLQTFFASATACDRPLSLVLESDNGTATPADDYFVYYLMPKDVPCRDGNWHSFLVDVPTSSTVLPPGWQVDPASPHGPDASWNAVVQDVAGLRWHFGDPTAAYAPSVWECGADNVRVVFAGGPSSYCTSKLHSSGCSPSIEWAGVPSASSAAPFYLRASQVVEQQNGVLLYGFAPAELPFLGGLRCVGGLLRRTPVQSSGGASAPGCEGRFELDFNAWIRSGIDPLLAAGATVYAQYWFRDPGDSFGSGLTNGLRLEICP